MSAKLKTAWRFWRMGCIPVDYPAGSVIEDEIEIKFARDCGVLADDAEPVSQTAGDAEEKAPKKRARKRKE
jgi:hypothetical protein